MGSQQRHQRAVHARRSASCEQEVALMRLELRERHSGQFQMTRVCINDDVTLLGIMGCGEHCRGCICSEHAFVELQEIGGHIEVLDIVCTKLVVKDERVDLGGSDRCDHLVGGDVHFDGLRIDAAVSVTRLYVHQI